MTETREISRRPGAAFLLLWGVPFLLLADTLLAALGGWRPLGTIETVLLALIVLWAASSALYTLRSVRARISARWGELLMLALSMGLCWTGLELVAHRLEATLRPSKAFHTRGPDLRNTFHPDPAYLPGIEGDSHFTTGPEGIRAAVPPASEQRRVLAIGGSTTECVYLDDHETWPALLAGYLKNPESIWIGDVGISGFDLNDHVKFAETSPLLKGVSALVVQPGINDLWRYLANEVDAMDYGRFEASTPAAPEAATPQVPVRAPIWSRSRVIQLYHTLRRPSPPPEQQEGVGGGEYQIRRDKRSAAEKTDKLPPLADGLAAYRTRIRQLVVACQDRGIPVLFTTQPVVWRADLSVEGEARCWFGWLSDGRYLTLAALREAMDQYNAALLETCSTLQVPCVDLSPLNGSEAYFYDDCHFTEAGAEAVAQLVGPALEELLSSQ